MIDVLIADDHAIFRSGMRRLLSDEPDMRVSGEAANGQEVIELLQRGHYAVVLLDINMPGRSGLETLKRIRSSWPAQPVLMLSMYPEEQYALIALEGGANGYLSKDRDATELVRAIRAAAGGGKYLSPEVAVQLLTRPRGDAHEAPHLALSARERQILNLIVEGMSLTEIGGRLFLSVKTISTYRTRLLAKLGVDSNAELVRYALRHGLID